MSPVRIKDLWREQRIFDRRALFAGAVMVLLALALFGRLYLLQVVHHEYYSTLSQANRVRTDPIPAARGLILASDGEVIASNQPTFQLELVPDEVADLHDSLERLVKLGLLQADDIPELVRTIRSRRSFDSVPIKLHLSMRQVARFAVHRYEFPGIDIKPRQARWYPDGSLAVDAIGYVGTINAQDLKHISAAAYAGTAVIGKTGVEAAYETELHGTNGFRQILVDAEGRPVRRPGVFAKDLKMKAPVPGEDVILSLDLKVQRLAEKLLSGHNGAVVALDPWNGNVIALASSPGFDPNLFARGISEKQYRALVEDPNMPLFNRALRAQLPSGSTIKPALALGAMTDGVINPDKEVYASSVYHLPGSGHLYHNAMHETCGWMDLSAAIIMSCDVYFYRLAYKMGVDRIGAWLPNFGFGHPTGIDIPGEQTGLVPSPAWMARYFPHDRGWYPGDTVILGIGQGRFLTTPLQLAHYTAVLATRGLSFEPRLVTGVRNPRTHEIHWKRPVLDGDLTMVSPASWNLVVKAMIGVTTSRKPLGTAYWQMIGSPYTIAGKTGTAQLVREDAKGAANEREYGKDKTLKQLRDDAWFIAFAPAQAPRIAVAVLVEHAGWGDVAAAPIARKLMDAYLLGPNGKLLAHPGRARFSPPPDIRPRILPGVPVTPTPLQEQVADATQ